MLVALGYLENQVSQVIEVTEGLAFLVKRVTVVLLEHTDFLDCQGQRVKRVNQVIIILDKIGVLLDV